MTNLGRRWGDDLGYRRGTEPVEVELANVQSEVESLGPRVRALEDDVRDLRSSRDSVMGMLKVIAAFQIVIVGLIVALFTWGLNHMTFHSDFEQPREHSGVQLPQDSGLPAQYQR